MGGAGGGEPKQLFAEFFYCFLGAMKFVGGQKITIHGTPD
jgi:hypothetical protein